MKSKKEYAIILGREIRYFCTRKYGSQQRAGKILGIKPNVLSMVVNCHRAPTAEFMQKFINVGFNEDHFNNYFNIAEPDPEILTKKEMVELIRHQKDLLDRQREVIQILMKKK